MTLAERIREAMESADLSAADLARATKKTASAVTQWLDGTTKSLRAETASAIERVTGYRAAWLVDGRGPKLVDDGSDGVSFTYLTDPVAMSTMRPILAWEHPNDLPPGEFVMIARLEFRLSAGPGVEQGDVELNHRQPQAFRADWIRQKQLKPSKLAALNATGNSMEPRIWDGDSLVVDTSQTRVIDGKVYALWYDGGERVKRLFGMPGGGLRISSDNPAFETIELTADQTHSVRIIGRVVHIAGDGGL